LLFITNRILRFALRATGFAGVRFDNLPSQSGEGRNPALPCKLQKLDSGFCTSLRDAQPRN